MANPITWRNVSAPSAGATADLFGQAQESFDGAIKAARDTKDGFEKGRTDRNTQAFMSQLQQYGSSEELAAAQESGALADLRGQFGSMVDQDKVSADAVTDRVTNLQGLETAQYDRDQMLTERAEKPLVDAMNVSIADIDLGQSADSLKSVLTNQEKQIDEMDVSDGTKAKLLGNVEKRLAASQGQFRDNRDDSQDQTDRTVRNSQARTLFEQSQDEVARNNQNRVATDQGVNTLSDVAANAATPANARMNMQEYFQTEEGQKVPPTKRRELLAGVDAAWGSAQGVLPSQTAKLDTLDKSLSADVARVVEDNPINENFAFTDGDRLTRGGAVEWARNEFNVDDSTLRQRTDTAIKALENETGAKSNNVPWGIIAKMAYQSAAEGEYFDDSRDIEPEDLNTTMRTAFKEWVASSKNKTKVRTAKDDRDAQLAKMRATFKGVNEVRNQSKGK